jgi:hypothetical protein
VAVIDADLIEVQAVDKVYRDEIRVLKAAGLCGVATVVVFSIGFWAIARLVPAPSPAWSASHIAEMYRTHSFRIELGVVIAMFGAALSAPWVYATSVHLWRIGRYRVLVLTQIGLGTLLVLEFIMTMIPWQVAAFRTTLPASSIQLLNDMGWIPFMGLGQTAILECFITAFVILSDTRENPIFPRWVGYFNIWVGLCFVPGTFTAMTRTGPIAWNGGFTFWLAFVAFFAWFIIDGLACYRAASQMEDGRTATLNSWLVQ